MSTLQTLCIISHHHYRFMTSASKGRLTSHSSSPSCRRRSTCPFRLQMRRDAWFFRLS